MKVLYCKRYGKYVSKKYCELFNEGKSCEYYSSAEWNTIMDLINDTTRPQWTVNAVVKPIKCDFFDGRTSVDRSLSFEILFRHHFPIKH